MSADVSFVLVAAGAASRVGRPVTHPYRAQARATRKAIRELLRTHAYQVFVYRDAQRRIQASMHSPLAADSSMVGVYTRTPTLTELADDLSALMVSTGCEA